MNNSFFANFKKIIENRNNILLNILSESYITNKELLILELAVLFQLPPKMIKRFLKDNDELSAAINNASPLNQQDAIELIRKKCNDRDNLLKEVFESENYFENDTTNLIFLQNKDYSKVTNSLLMSFGLYCYQSIQYPLRNKKKGNDDYFIKVALYLAELDFAFYDITAYIEQRYNIFINAQLKEKIKIAIKQSKNVDRIIGRKELLLNSVKYNLKDGKFKELFSIATGLAGNEIKYFHKNGNLIGYKESNNKTNDENAKKQLTPEQREEIIEYYINQGISQAELANKYNVTKTTILNLIRTYRTEQAAKGLVIKKVVNRNTSSTREKISSEEREKQKKKYLAAYKKDKDKKTPYKIAVECGVEYHLAYRFLNEEGIKIETKRDKNGRLKEKGTTNNVD